MRSADERCCSTAGCRAAALALATGASAGRWARCWRARPATACTAGATASSADGTAGASTASGPGPATPGAATAPAAASGAPAAGGAGAAAAASGAGAAGASVAAGPATIAATLAPGSQASPPLGAAAPPTIPATLAPGSQGAAPLGASGAPAAIAIPGGAPAAMSGGATAAIAGAGPGAGSGDGVAASGGGVVRTGVTGAPISPAARANSRVVPRLPSRRCRSAGAGTGGRRPADATRSATGGRGRVTGRWTRWRVTATDVSRRARPASASVTAGRRAVFVTGSSGSVSVDRSPWWLDRQHSMGFTYLRPSGSTSPSVYPDAHPSSSAGLMVMHPAAPSSARRSSARRTP